MVLPVITAMEPASGPLVGGTSVVIIGTALTGATAVSFGGIPAASFVVNSATKITAVTSASKLVEVADVLVTTPGGVSVVTGVSQFMYFNPVGSPTYQLNNIFFDPQANYFLWGIWRFAQAPLFDALSLPAIAISASPAVTGVYTVAAKLPAGYSYLAVSPAGVVVAVTPS